MERVKKSMTKRKKTKAASKKRVKSLPDRLITPRNRARRRIKAELVRKGPRPRTRERAIMLDQLYNDQVDFRAGPEPSKKIRQRKYRLQERMAASRKNRKVKKTRESATRRAMKKMKKKK